MFSFTHIVIVLVIALVLFGPNKLPEISRSLGRALRELRKATSELTASLHDVPEEDGGGK